jgi:hypothetical protein
MTMPATIAPTIAKMLPRLASDYDGEVVATVRAIERVLRSGGRDWHDLAATLCRPAQLPNSDWRSEARFCAGNAVHLTERELDFIATLARWRGAPTDRQREWLRDIADRLRAAA